MRVSLVLANNFSVSPYVRYYQDILDKKGVDYQIIAWNRQGLDEQGVMAYNKPSALQLPAWRKAFDYWGYRQFIIEKIAEVKSGKIITFTAQNAVFLSDFLYRRYRGRYVVDIRDYSPAARWFGGRFRRALAGAALRVISSAGFRQWLSPDFEYAVCHNTAIFDAQPAIMRREYPYEILTIGLIRYFDANRRLIDALANDSRFTVRFSGVGYADQMLRDYAQRRGIQNAAFTGRYDKSQEPQLLAGATMLSILFDDSINSRTAMANRFYLSAIYGIPMLVDAGGEMARLAERYHLGLVVDKKEPLKEKILEYLAHFDATAFDAGRRAFLETARQENLNFQRQFEVFLNEPS